MTNCMHHVFFPIRRIPFLFQQHLTIPTNILPHNIIFSPIAISSLKHNKHIIVNPFRTRTFICIFYELTFVKVKTPNIIQMRII